MNWTIDFARETADIATSTLWAFEAVDGLFNLYDIYVRGTNLTYDPLTGRLNGGSITALETYTRESVSDSEQILPLPTPVLVQSIVFTTPVSATLFSSYLAQSATTRIDVRLPFIGAAGAVVTNHDAPISFIEALWSTAGNDTLTGGPDGKENSDEDFAGYQYSPRPVNVDLQAGWATGDGTDTLVRVDGVGGSAFNDTLLGSAGDDRLDGFGGHDRIDGRDGDDILSAGTEDDTLLGGLGRDRLAGEAGNDSLQGGADNDVFSGGNGNDTLDGGDGFDLARYDYNSVFLNQVTMPGVVVSLALVGPQVVVPGELDTLTSIEAVIGSNKSDTLTGSQDHNVIAGLHGNDSVRAGAGNDSVDGGPGLDSLDGGAGDDYIDGLDDGDVIQGRAGNDTVVGGTGDDMLGGGEDVDTADYGAATVGVTVQLVPGTANAVAAGLGTDTLTSIENVIGGRGGDQLVGSALDNVLTGRGGADQLDGAAGADKLVGDGPVLETAATESVERLYLAALGRGPDDAGLTDWTARLEGGGMSLQTIAAGIVGSAEFQQRYGNPDNTQLVTLLYNNVLHRAPDAGGLADWVGQLNAGTSRAAVVTGFSESAEFRANTDHALHAGQIFRLYGATLDRQPDAAGFEGWLNALDGGARLADAAGGFVGSPEFQLTYGNLDDTQFVTLLYNNVLNRAPDQGGLDHWVGQLAGGASRANVVLGFSESAEHRAATATALDSFMRTALPAWADSIEGGAGDDHMSAGRGSDIFVFRTGAGGADHVYALETWDTLRLTGFGYADKAAALAHVTVSGADAVFSDQGQTITFHDTQLATLQQAGWLLA